MRRAGILAALAVTVGLAGAVQSVVAAAPAVAASAQASRLDWAHDFEDSLGAPQGGNNDSVLVGWMLAEGGGTFTSPSYSNVARYNPLNTTLNEPGSYSINNLGGGHGVQAYSSWALGVTANHDALAVNAYGYPAIVADLRANAAVATTANDIGASSWCSPNACYGGAGAPRIVSLAGGAPSGTQLATPSGSSAYAQCNILSYHEGGTGRNTAGDYLFWMASCNGAVVGGTSPQYLTFSFTSHNYPGGSTTNSYAAGTLWYGSGTANSLTAQGSQKYQGGDGGLIDCQSCTNDYGYTLTNVQIMQGGSLHAVTYVLSAGTDSNGTTRPAVYPNYPLNYYSGGTAGTASLPGPPPPGVNSPGSGAAPAGVTYTQAGTPLCSRTMPQAQTSPVSFVGSIARTSGVSYSYQWAFGDSTSDTAGPTVFNDSHIYAGTMPAGGWTAVLTVTATGDGVTYSGTATATCSLRVDFANPDQSMPGSANGTGGDSANCPSGWGWLNPAAMVTIAQCLFIPSSASTGAISGIAAQAKTTIPFSYVVDVANFLPGAVTQMNSSYAAQSGVAQGCIGGFGGSVDVGGGRTVTLPAGNGGSSGNECLDARLTSVGGGLGHGSGGLFGIDQLRGMMLLIVMAGFALGVWKLIARTIG